MTSPTEPCDCCCVRAGGASQDRPAVDLSAFRELYPFESHFLDVGGARQHYLDEGSGEPVLMLHGNPTWSFFYRNMALGLRSRCRVIAPDHVGCGLSDKPQDYDYTLATHIANLEKLIDSLALERLTLLVHDWGGPIGMGFATRHPGRIRRLIVMNTAAYTRPPGAPFPDLIRSCRLPVFGDVTVRGMNLFVRAALRWCAMKTERMTPAVRAGYLAPYSNFADRVAVLRFVQDIPFGPADHSHAVVRQIEAGLPSLAGCPILFIWGMRDFCFTPHYLEHWLQFFPGAEVERLAEAGHYLLEDAHERILPRVARFLDEHPLG